jgi:type II secretory pathway pseudopilin PulG
MIELIVVMALIALLAVTTTHFYQSFIEARSLTITTEEIKAALEEARAKAILGKNGKKHGVHADNAAGEYIIFQGENFAVRDQLYDIVHSWNKSYIISVDYVPTPPGPTDALFSELRGTTTPATITITNVNNETEIIELNAAGNIK